MWQKAQDRISVVRKARETAIIEVSILQATATAIADSPVGAMMFEQEPQLRVLAETFGMTFVEVSAGEFWMGTDEDVASSPQHQVFVDTFWIMQTEVTNAQYRAFVAADGYNQQRWWTEAGWAWRTEKGIGAPGFWSDEQWNSSSYPIVGISWYEANAYATWLAETTDIALRLPTEAEWEKAARGLDGRLYPWGHEIDGSRANYCDENCTRDLGEEVINDDYPLAAPVGSFLTGKSFYGVLDMAGNVWEWTSSLEQPYPYNREDGREVVDRSGSRVVRGGSWNSDPYFIRSVIRYKYDPAARGNTLGVRLVVGNPR